MKVKLTDICDIQYGYPFDSALFSDTDGIPLIRIRDVIRGYSETRTIEKFPDEYIVDDGDILIGMDGEFNIAKWHGSRAALNQRVCRLIPRKVDQDYIFYFMPSALRRIEEKTPFVTVKHLSAKELNKIVLELPCEDEQRRRATVMNYISVVIALRQRQLSALDTLIKARFVEMFGDEKCRMKMSEICSIITDGTHQPPKFVEKGIPFIFVSNIVGNKVTYDAEKFIDQSTYNELIKRTPIEIGDVLLSTVGSYGHPAVVKNERKFLFQRHIAYMKPRKELIDSDYLHGAILSPDSQKQIEEGVKGIAQKTLNLSEIRKITIPVPELSKQKQFASFVSQIDKSKSLVQKALDEAQLLFDSLMQQYFG